MKEKEIRRKNDSLELGDDVRGPEVEIVPRNLRVAQIDQDPVEEVVVVRHAAGPALLAHEDGAHLVIALDSVKLGPNLGRRRTRLEHLGEIYVGRTGVGNLGATAEGRTDEVLLLTHVVRRFRVDLNPVEEESTVPDLLEADVVGGRGDAGAGQLAAHVHLPGRLVGPGTAHASERGGRRRRRTRNERLTWDGTDGLEGRSRGEGRVDARGRLDRQKRACGRWRRGRQADGRRAFTRVHRGTDETRQSIGDTTIIRSLHVGTGKRLNEDQFFCIHKPPKRNPPPLLESKKEANRESF